MERDTEIDRRIAQHLRRLRTERGWSLDELGRRTGISRASLSRLENAEVSATAGVLGRLCAAFELPLSRLIHWAEDDFTPMLRAADQPVWTDPDTGFQRRSVSPPANGLAGEALLCTLKPATCLTYDQPPRQGLEHHLLLFEGQLFVTADGQTHTLQSGDCLRYRLFGPSVFATTADRGASYVLFLV